MQPLNVSPLRLNQYVRTFPYLNQLGFYPKLPNSIQKIHIIQKFQTLNFTLNGVDTLKHILSFNKKIYNKSTWIHYIL
jgi:hypothetical protein